LANARYGWILLCVMSSTLKVELVVLRLPVIDETAVT
jgi:hypothetical protein